MLSAQTRPNTSAPADGSRTITVHDVQPTPEASDDDSVQPALPDGTLRLRGGPRSRPRVAWDERVIDNENCGRKKSKICCIYHKPKEFDESSSSESSESESEYDSSDDGRARPRHAPNRHRHCPHPRNHPNGTSASGDGNGLRSSADSGGVVHQIESDREPNAYEVHPLHSKKGKGRTDG